MIKDIHIYHLLLLLPLLLESGRGFEENHECFEPDILNGEKNSFLHFDIMDSEHINITWNELWNEADWGICFEEVTIVANLDREDEMAFLIEDAYSQKSLKVSVLPCIENTYVLKAIHEPTGETLVSLGKARPIVTIRSLELLPSFNSNDIEKSFDSVTNNVNYLIRPRDMFAPGDCETRRTFTILTRLHGEQNWNPSGVEYSENEEELAVHLELKKLNMEDQCQYYDIKLHVNEQGHEVELELNPIYPYAIIKTGSLENTAGTPESPTSIKEIGSDEHSVTISWDESGISCSTGYVLSFIDEDDDREDEEIEFGTGGQYTIKDLDPCTKYKMSIRTKFDSRLSKEGTSFTVTTSPETLDQLTIASLNISMIKDGGIKFSWDANEYICLTPEEYEVTVSKVIIDGDKEDDYEKAQILDNEETNKVSFSTTSLEKCTDYMLRIGSAKLPGSLPLEKKFRTGGEKNKIEGIKVINSTTTTVTLEWDKDICAKGYQVTYSRFISNKQGEQAYNIYINTFNYS